MNRHDLVGAPTGEPLPERVARARVLLEEAVPPQWRREPLIYVRPQHMEAVCAVTRCRREAIDHGMCNGHAQRWHRIGRPQLDVFLTTTESALRDHHILPSCLVSVCRRGRARDDLCPVHSRQWKAAKRPLIATWVTTVVVTDGPQSTCRLPNCELAAEGGSLYCRVHHRRWRARGEPTHEEFEAEVMNYGDPCWDFRRLPGQLKLELQYALKCNHELGFPPGSHSCSQAVRMLVRRGATTLLEHDRASWTAIFRSYLNDPNQFKNAAAFLSFAVEQLTDLIEGSGWKREYPRDVWQLRRLGYIPAAASRQLNFTDIQQRWLVDSAKRWLHWRLTVEEKSINTVSADLLALRRLSAFLTATGQAHYSIRQLTRPVLEQHIAWLHQQPQLGSSATIRDSISALAVFLRALQDHEDWAPDLPRNAVIYASDYPRTIPLRARGLNAHIMTQVRAHLPRWPQPDGRFLTELMLATGLRVGDACALGYDPIVRDRDDNPYVRYWNHKMRREAYVPISAAALDKIREQQTRVREQYPAETAAYLSQPAPRTLPVDALRLVPANKLNPHGLLPFKRSTYNLQLQAWVAKCGITDEAGRPAHITAHQWRHTFATTLVNRGVRLEVVKQLLDHASLEMASHYARLLDTTIRAEWDAARDSDDDLQHLLPADVEWASRSRTALPNGHCGLPRQQTCDHSNKCLTCPVFITTSEDLPAHEAHRHRTLTLIAQLEARGQTKLADQNRLVLEQLDTRIAQIKQAIATGGAHRDAS
ncbi:tyrosine-type recombinase/integrase [Micromonospora sp. STR1_7]|uniref:Tyrosine-type recombinase/integrase n=1 Tax=Micromonospora parastrephiae TaxID=2806101 RepID=A0ABS1XMP4_9ACTN|nr:tyrosine-type recombinase/integrase [Micromonospora parastrephiae]MBM0230484.1 tyrosine-type recombinase/integrase [Micromonospora parastrephiae]